MTELGKKKLPQLNTEKVLDLTVGYLLRNVDFSINKTIDRVEEYAGNAQMSARVLHTLSVLHQLRKVINDFHLSYKDSSNDNSSN
jgi:hypothetical protein